MRSQIKKPFKTLLILLFPLLFSCATTLPGRQYTQGSVIDAGPYSLIGPPGDGWSIETGKGTTSFYRRNIPPGSDQIILNYVGDNFDQKKGRYSSEEEVALEFINFYEELTMKNAKEANCVTNDMKKGTTVIGDKKVYFISLVATGCTVEAASRGKGLYIFFPVDFSEKHSYYVFLFQQFRDKGTLEGIDLKLITPVIDSLKIKPQIEAKLNDAGAYLNRGVAYMQKRQFDQAISDFNKALEINPSYAEAYDNRGGAYVAKGQYDLAILDFNKVLEVNPRNPGSYTNRGTAYMNKGMYDQAISDHTKAVEINPKFAWAYYGRGMVYSKKDQYDQAISDFSKALEINPRDAGAYYRRGRCYYFKKEYDNSWNDIKKAQDLGLKIPPEFLDDLRKASGRQN